MSKPSPNRERHDSPICGRGEEAIHLGAARVSNVEVQHSPARYFLQGSEVDGEIQAAQHRLAGPSAYSPTDKLNTRLTTPEYWYP